MLLPGLGTLVNVRAVVSDAYLINREFLFPHRRAVQFPLLSMCLKAEGVYSRVDWLPIALRNAFNSGLSSNVGSFTGQVLRVSLTIDLRQRFVPGIQLAAIR